MRRLRFLAAVILSAGLVACAASPNKGASPPPTEQDDRQGGKDAAPKVPSDATSEALPSGPAAARGELERASADLEASLSECTSACRALASMERAAAHLCDLDGATECTSAKERVARARAKVKTSGCTCAN